MAAPVLGVAPLHQTTPSRSTAYCSRFDGASIYARGYSVALTMDTSFVPGPGWTKHQRIRSAWLHPAFPKVVLWTPDPTTTVVLLRSTLSPEIEEARRCAEFALGPNAAPLSEAVMPTALRLLLRPCPGAQVPPPLRRTRCQRVWPSTAQPAHVVRIHGHDVELRVSVTHDRTSTTHYAEAVLGAAHQTRWRKPRSLFYAADARRAPPIVDAGRMKEFMRRVLLELVHFADERQDVGLEVDRSRSQQLATVAEAGVTAEDDVSFEVSIPMATADLAFNV